MKQATTEKRGKIPSHAIGNAHESETKDEGKKVKNTEQCQTKFTERNDLNTVNFQ